MKKILLSAVIAVMAISVCACGNPTRKGTATVNNAAQTTKSTEKTTIGTRQVIPAVTETYNDNDDLSELSGTFIESIDGVETNYIFINSIGNTAVKIGEFSPTPLGIETSEEGLMVYRGSKNPTSSFSEYSFDGKVLKFKIDDKAYEWKKIDKVDINSSYNLIVDGECEDIWAFQNGDLAIVQGEVTTKATYEQTADQLIVTMPDGTETKYSYVYDCFSLILEDADGNSMEFRSTI